MADTPRIERCFYHSFPRRARDREAESDVACAILEIVRDFGLLLAPESVKWQYEHKDGSAPRSTEVLQRRICFTELAPDELDGHAKKFGHFALEFTVPTLKSLGAIPVFYMPRAISKPTGAEGAAYTLVMQLIDAMVLVMRISEISDILNASGQSGPFPCAFGFTEPGTKTFDLDANEIRRVLSAFTHALTPPHMMRAALEGMLNFFVPADSRDDEELGYYREREWRIAGNVAIRDEEMMKLPNNKLIERLIALDRDFFGKEVPGTGKNRAELSFVLPGLGKSRILEMAKRIVVPDAARTRVVSLLANVPNCPEIVALENLAAN